jgi:hypothetical protein
LRQLLSYGKNGKTLKNVFVVVKSEKNGDSGQNGWSQMGEAMAK